MVANRQTKSNPTIDINGNYCILNGGIFLYGNDIDHCIPPNIYILAERHKPIVEREAEAYVRYYDYLLFFINFIEEKCTALGH